jgi:hypothetical protein
VAINWNEFEPVGEQPNALDERNKKELTPPRYLMRDQAPSLPRPRQIQQPRQIRDPMGPRPGGSTTGAFERPRKALQKDEGQWSPPATRQNPTKPQRQDVGPFDSFGGGVADFAMDAWEGINRIPDTINRYIEAGNKAIFKGLDAIPGVDTKEWNPSLRQLPGNRQLTDFTTRQADRIQRTQELQDQNDPIQRSNQQKAQEIQQAQDQAMRGDFSGLRKVLTDPSALASVIGQAAPSLGLAALSGGMGAAGQIGSLAALEGLLFSNDVAEFERRTGKRVDPGEFVRAQGQIMAINSLLEKLPVDDMMRGAGKGAIRGFTRGAVSEGATEVAQTGNENLAASIFDESRQVTDGMLAALIGGAGTGGPLGGAAGALGKAVDKHNPNNPELRKKQRDLSDLEDPGEDFDPVTEQYRTIRATPGPGLGGYEPVTQEGREALAKKQRMEQAKQEMEQELGVKPEAPQRISTTRAVRAPGLQSPRTVDALRAPGPQEPRTIDALRAPGPQEPGTVDALRAPAPQEPATIEAIRAPGRQTIDALRAPGAPGQDQSIDAIRAPDAPGTIEALRAPGGPQTVEALRAPGVPETVEALRAPGGPETVEALRAPGGPETVDAIRAPGRKTVEAIAAPSLREAAAITREPTEAQKKAGNYKKGRFTFPEGDLKGLTVAIENAAGTERRGKSPEGKPWAQVLTTHYGYLTGTKDNTGEGVDVFLTDEAEEADKVYVIDQVEPKSRRYDEPKVVMGAQSAEQAREIYESNYEPGWEGFDGIKEFSTEEFKKWLKSGRVGRRVDIRPGAERLARAIPTPELAERMSQVAPGVTPEMAAQASPQPQGPVDTIEQAQEGADPLQALLERIEGAEDTETEGRFSLAEAQTPVRQKARTIRGVHYSREAGLTALSGSRFGTGARGAEHQRLRGAEDALRNRVYFYIQKEGEQLPRRESVVTGGKVYRTELPNMYDLAADPDGLVPLARKKAQESGDHVGNELERLVLSNGYGGYFDESMFGDTGGAVVLDADEIPVEFLDFEARARDMRAQELAYGRLSLGDDMDAVNRQLQDQGLEDSRPPTEPGQPLDASRERRNPETQRTPGMRLDQEDAADVTRPARMSRDKVQTAIQERIARWKGAPPVVAVQSQEELPFSEGDRRKAQGKKVKGYIRDGKVYVVADNVSSSREALQVMLHEVVGHHGMRGMMGERFDKLLDEVYVAYGGSKGFSGIASTYGLDLGKQQDQRIAAEEMIAHMAESGEKPRLLNRIIASVRLWLRDKGFDIDLNDDDIKQLLLRARDHVRKGKGKRLYSNRFRLQSTRVPKAKKATENPLKHMLIVGLDSFKADAKAFAKNMARVREYVNFRPNEGATTEEQQAEQFVEHVKDNLLYLHDQMPPETRRRAKLWYDGARNIVDRWQAKYDGKYSDTTIAGVMATLSPQKDWFMNVSLAERVLDTMHEQQDMRWNQEMQETADRIFPQENYPELREAVEGKKLGELTNPVEKAMWVRTYDQTYNSRALRIVTPEGFFGPIRRTGKGEVGSVAWGSLSEIAKAISVIDNPSPSNISAMLGDQHKVRNFYNNIFDPLSKDGHVTIDTHAVAAGLLRPLAGASTEVLHNFGGGGAANASTYGSKGTYGLYAEAYRRAAKERGILPREMQSITWEAVRGLFEAKFKRKGNIDAIHQMWQEYRDGTRGLDEVRQSVVDFAGGVTAPEWERSATELHASEEDSSYPRELSAAGIPGGSAESATSGVGGELADDVPGGRFSLGRDGRGEDRSQADQGAEQGDDVQEEVQRLEGLPESSLGPVPVIKEAAHRYVQEKGLPLRRQKTYVKADPERGARIAQAFEDMKHDPEDPEVLAAYQAMIDETLEQYQLVKELGIDVDWIEEGMEDPYPEGPKQVHEDLHRGHLWVFPTTSGFGSINDIKDNPLLQETGETLKGRTLLANDVFRIVHDVFGHGKEGVGFGPTGEENAWQAHVRMYSPLAAKAMTSETRGQNSWVNFGPYGERNRANQRETIFADQKIGLLPEWVMTEGMAPDIEEEGRFSIDHGDADLNSMQAKIGPRKPSLLSRFQQRWDGFKQEYNQGIFQSFAALEKAEKDIHGDLPPEQSAYIAARMTTGSAAQFEVLMEGGALEWRDGMAKVKPGTRGLLDIIEPVSKNLDLWLLYMAGKRAARLKQEGREALFTDVEIRKAVALGQRFPEFRQAAEGWASFNKDMLDFAQEAGMIDPASRAMWENSDYIPFFRIMENGDLRGAVAGKGIANQGSPVKTLKGSELSLNDLLDNMMLNTMTLLTGAMKNHAMRQAAQNLEGTPYLTDATSEFKPELVPMSEVKKALEERGVDTSQLPDAALSGVQRMMAMKAPSGDNVVRVMVQGKPRYYRVHDPLLFRSLTAVNKKSWDSGLMTALRGSRRILTQMVTADPGFLVRNFIRDSLQASVINRDASKPVIDSFIGAARATRGALSGKGRDPALVTIMASGAGFSGSGYVNGSDPGAMSKAARAALASKGINGHNVIDSARKYVRLWERVVAVGEQANRINAYQAAKKAGKSDLQAAYEAKDFMDFSQRGDWPAIQFLVETVPFLGARLAGLNRLGRGMKESPRAFLAKGGLVTLASLALFLMWRDDERYKALEDWDKATYHHFWVGGEHFRIPKGFEVGTIFSTIPERATDEFLNWMEGKHGKKATVDFTEQLAWSLGETFNFGTISVPVADFNVPIPLPQLIAPAAEAFANYDSFRKRPIVGMHEARLPSEFQYDYRTSPTMTEIGKRIGMSPKKLEHLMNGYFGTLGNYMLMATDELTRAAADYPEAPAKGLEEWPVIKSFYRGNDIGYTRYGSEFYKMANEVEQARLALNKMESERAPVEEAREFIEENRELLGAAKATGKMKARIKRYNDQIEAINQSRGLSATEKRDRIKRLNEAKQYELKNAVERMNKAGLEN